MLTGAGSRCVSSLIVLYQSEKRETFTGKENGVLNVQHLKGSISI